MRLSAIVKHLFIALVCVGSWVVHAKPGKETDIVVLSWCFSEGDITAWANQSCARLLRSLIDDRKYELSFANTGSDGDKAVIFYTLKHTNGKGAAILKCGAAD